MVSTTYGKPTRARRFALGAAVIAGAQLLSASLSLPVFAQAATNCGDVQKMLLERKALATKLAPTKGQKMDANFACANFGKLVANGTTLIKWVDTNKDWCQIPDTFVTGIKEDNSRAVNIRAKACSFAAQQAKMQKQAKESGGGGGGLLGGPGLEGASKLPQGAL